MKWITTLLIAGLAAQVPATAEVITNEKVPLTMIAFVPCAAGGSGELISISGPLHVLFAITVDEAGGLHLKSQSQPQGVRGQGLTTGDKYQGTGVTQNRFYSSSPSYPYTYSYVNNFRMIGQGPGNNYLVHENFHVTVNANGEVTTVIDNFKVECK